MEKSRLKYFAKKSWLILWLVFSLAVFSFLMVSQFLPSRAYWQEINNGRQPSKQNLPENQLLPLNNDKKINGNNVNFLLLGAAGEGNDAPDLTDTIIVAHLNASQQKIYLFSIPRDLLVKIPNSDSYTKINALYAYNKGNKNHEFDTIRQKAQEITGLAIDHYIFIDLTTLKQAIDTVGGINVMVKKDILDTKFPGPNHSYQTFEIKAGWRYLDGETALKYARSRHTGAGDFDRIERQQEILATLKQKVLGLKFWNIGTYFELYQNLSSHIKTDLNLWQMKNYWENVKGIPGENLIKSEIETNDLLNGGQVDLGGEMASVLEPKAGIENYENIKNYIINIINK